MGVAGFRSAPPGRALARVRPAAGLLLRLAPQRGVGEPGTAWSDRARPRWFDVGHQVLGGVDAGRDLGVVLRTHLHPDDARSSALALLADRLAAVGEEPTGRDPRWAPIRTEVDGDRVDAVQGVVDGHELIVLQVRGRTTTIVTDLLDAERFDPRYAIFRPWFERDQPSAV